MNCIINLLGSSRVCWFILLFIYFRYIENCSKIGEGVYGEVFLYDDGLKKSVIKIIPIEGEELVNSEPQKKFHEILSEIIIAEYVLFINKIISSIIQFKRLIIF